MSTFLWLLLAAPITESLVEEPSELSASESIAATPSVRAFPRFDATEPVALSDWVSLLEEGIGDLSPESCEPLLQAWYDALEALHPDQVDRLAATAQAEELVQRLFDARVATHEWMREQVSTETMTDACVTAIRRADLAGRYLQDELYLLSPDGEGPSTWISTGKTTFQGWEDLEDGDVAVTRGSLLASAGIAHMGRIDSQFSHNVLFHVPERGRARTVEAYLQTGTITQSAKRLFRHQLGRIVVLRHRDPDLSARAARAAYDRVRRRPKIVYDDVFDFEDHSRLFCSEVPRWAFGELLGRDETMPYAMTVFEREKNARLYDAMGITTDVTSAPADALYEPSFTIVAEWRDPEALGTMRLHDAVVESLMTWMEDLDYRLEPLRSDRVTVGFGLFVRRIPLLGLALKNSLHPSSSREFLVTSLALQNTAHAVLEDLEERLESRALDRPRPTYAELREKLEAVRLADLARWTKNPKKASFHQRLHP